MQQRRRRRSKGRRTRWLHGTRPAETQHPSPADRGPSTEQAMNSLWPAKDAEPWARPSRAGCPRHRRTSGGRAPAGLRNRQERLGFTPAFTCCSVSSTTSSLRSPSAPSNTSRICVCCCSSPVFGFRPSARRCCWLFCCARPAELEAILLTVSLAALRLTPTTRGAVFPHPACPRAPKAPPVSDRI